MHLNASLAGEKRLTPVCNLHEQASAIAAENYSKATNNLGVCMVTTGPGSTNAVTGCGRSMVGFNSDAIHLRAGQAT